VTYMATKRVLLDALDRESGASAPAARRATTTAAPLLNRAQESGGANPDLNIDDVMRFVIGVTSSPFGSDPATRTNPRHGHLRHRRPTRDPRPNKPQVPDRTSGGVTRCRSAPSGPWLAHRRHLHHGLASAANLLTCEWPYPDDPVHRMTYPMMYSSHAEQMICASLGTDKSRPDRRRWCAI